MSARPLPPTLLDSLIAAVPKGRVRNSSPDDQIDGISPEFVAEPRDEIELARLLVYADTAGLQVAPLGCATKTNWGNSPARVDLAIATTHLNRVLEHAHHDMTVTVEAGTSFASLQRTLAQHSQRLALDPLWSEKATIGGIISTNDNWSLRLRYGSIRDLIIGITVALPDGTLANSGGKVVKNVAGYDLPKLMTGALGTLGIITKAVFRLHPLPEHSRTVSVECANAKAASDLMLAVADSILVPTGMQVRLSNNSTPTVDIRFEAIAQSVDAQINSLTQFTGSNAVSSAAEDVWQTRERLWIDDGSSVICKLAILPSEIAATVEHIQRALSHQVPWSLIVQATGIAVLKASLADPELAVRFIATLRSDLAARGGTLVVLKCSPDVKQRIGVWGPPGSAQPLMKRIKERFDPKETLNRGRFVGGL
jgi:glycolate oxidase FAD binding subunit